MGKVLKKVTKKLKGNTVGDREKLFIWSETFK